jgi:hypothetical protein
MLLMSINKKRKKKIVFFGDFNLEGRKRLEGYLNFLKQLLKEEAVDDKYELSVAVESGSNNLIARLEQDVLSKGADVVVLFLGHYNEVDKSASATGGDAHAFETVYTAIIQRLLSAEIKVVLCTSFVTPAEATLASEVIQAQDVYGAVIKSLSETFDLPVIDIKESAAAAYVMIASENAESNAILHNKVYLDNKERQLVAGKMLKALKTLL